MKISEMPTYNGDTAGVWAPVVINGNKKIDFKQAVQIIVQAALAELVNGAPELLNTLKEIADKITADEGAAATLTTLVGQKLPTASFTGVAVKALLEGLGGTGRLDYLALKNTPVDQEIEVSELATNTSVAAAVAASKLTFGLEALYQLDETAGDAIDSLGSFPGTLSGGITRNVPGHKVGSKAYQFDGTGAVSLGNNFLFSELTYSAWVKTTFGSDQGIMGVGSDSGAYCRISAAGKLQFLKAAQAGIGISASSIPSNAWAYIGVTYKRGVCKLYINGVIDTNTVTGNTPYTFTGGNFKLGAGTGSENLVGLMDEAKIWSRALSSSEILADYNGQLVL